MSKIFLGKPLHWAALVVAAGILYAVGGERLHTSSFNLFVGIVAAVATTLVALVWATTDPADAVTREPIPSPDEND